MERQHRTGISRRRRALRRELSFASILYFSICLAAVLYYILGAGAQEFHSDCTDSLLWAEASLQSGRALDPDFEYAGYLPFGSGLWSAPLLALFGYGWTAYRLSLLIFLLFFLLSAGFAFRALLPKGPHAASRVLYALGTLLMLVSASPKLREIFWGHVIYYSLAVLLYFLGLVIIAPRAASNSGVIPQSRSYAPTPVAMNAPPQASRILPPQTPAALSTQKPSHLVRALLLFALATGVVTNGKPGIVLFHLPLLLALLLQWILQVTRRPRWAWVPLIASLPAGTLLLRFLERGGVTAPYAQAYMSSFVPAEEWLESLSFLPEHLARLMGFDWRDWQSLETIDVELVLRTMVLVLLVVLPLIGLIQGMVRKRWRFPWLAYFILLGSQVGMMMVTRLGTASWRFVPALVLSAAMALVWLLSPRQERKWQSSLRLTLVLILGVFSLYQGILIFRMPWDGWARNRLYPAYEALEEMGGEDAPIYGDFWTTHALRLASDDRFETRAVHYFEDTKKLYPYLYQVSRSAYRASLKKDGFYLVLTERENEQFEAEGLLKKLKPLITESREAPGFILYRGEGSIADTFGMPMP